MTSFHSPQDISHYVGQIDNKNLESFEKNYSFKDDLPLESNKFEENINSYIENVGLPSNEHFSQGHSIKSDRKSIGSAGSFGSAGSIHSSGSLGDVENQIPFVGWNSNTNFDQDPQSIIKSKTNSSAQKNSMNPESTEYLSSSNLNIPSVYNSQSDRSKEKFSNNYNTQFDSSIVHPTLSDPQEIFDTSISSRDFNLPTNYSYLQSTSNQELDPINPPHSSLNDIRSSIDILGRPLHFENIPKSKPTFTRIDNPGLPIGPFSKSKNHKNSLNDNNVPLATNIDSFRSRSVSPHQRVNVNFKTERNPEYTSNIDINLSKKEHKSWSSSRTHQEDYSSQIQNNDEPFDVNSQFDDLKKIEKYRKKLDANHDKMDSISKYYSEDKLVSENDSLKQNIDLLNIRIKSLENIINIQNEEIQKKEQEKTSISRRPEITNPTLTEKWRQKVYSLLIQKHVLEKEIRESKAEYVNNLNNASKAYDSLMYKLKVGTQKHSDIQAKLDMKRKKCQLLKSDIQRVSNRELILKRHSESLATQIQRSKSLLVQFFNTSFSKYESKFTSESSYLQSLSKRIEFSESRIAMIKNVFFNQQQKSIERISQLENELNREINHKKELLQKVSQLKSIEDVSKEMEKEINQLKKERSYLIEKGEKDLEIQSNKTQLLIRDLQQKLDDEILLNQKLRSQLNIAHEDYSQLDEKFNSIKIDLKKSLEESQQYKEEVSQIKESYNKQMDHIQDKIREGVDIAVGQTNEEIAILRKELEMMKDERNDLTKEISNLNNRIENQNLEHQAEVRRMQEYFDMKMASKNTEITTLEHERDILMESNRKLGGIMNLSVPPMISSSKGLGRPTSDRPYNSTLDKPSLLITSQRDPLGYFNEINPEKSRVAPLRGPKDSSLPLVDQIRFDSSNRNPSTLPQPRRHSSNESILSQLDNVENLVENLLKDDN